ncbi:MAG: hypothetical protein E3J30_03600 [Anaerolineales bacterium]|nr:MAG: hypothetical protein E3J30_03600 [Anaerolineales bacterium]
MFTKWIRIILVTAALTLGFVGVAYAEGDAPDNQLRIAGVILNVDFPGNTFAVRTLSGTDVHVHVTGNTEYRSRDGSVQEFEDLVVDMRIIVVGQERGDGTINASVVFAATPEEVPELMRLKGEVGGVGDRYFTLLTEDGRSLTINVIDRTRFRSRNGEVTKLSDLEPGMVALVTAADTEDNGIVALVVAAGTPGGDIRDRVFRTSGEITSVVPGQETFTVQSKEGDSITFVTGERTKFRSRDGSVTGIHDLKRGMFAMVGAIKMEDGTNQALVVLAGSPEDRPERPKVVNTAGKIVSLGSNSLTVETRSGDQKTFSVDGSTKYKSRDGSVNGFGDLEVGMISIVVGRDLGNGELLAVIVGAGHIPAERAEQMDGVRPEGLRDRLPGSQTS